VEVFWEEKITCLTKHSNPGPPNLVAMLSPLPFGVHIIIVLTARIFVGEGICFSMVYLTMLLTTQNIESNSRIITD